MRDHKKLRAFELADKIVVNVYSAVADFPKEELYGLTSQIKRAAVSVPSTLNLIFIICLPMGCQAQAT
jgi:hypothetical protein